MADLAPWLAAPAAPAPAKDPGAPPAPWLKAKTLVPAQPGDLPPAPGAQQPGFLAGEGIDPGLTGRQVRQSAQEATPPMVALDNPVFDNTTGLPFDQTRQFLTLDNDKEKKLFLEQGLKAGEWSDYGQTSDTGQWYVVKGGRPTAIVGLAHPFRNFGADIAAHPAESLLMAGTALIPEARIPDMVGGALSKMGIKDAATALFKKFAAGTKYNLGRAALTGTGAAAGKAVDEASKATQGLLSKTPGEEAAALGASGLGAGAAEFGIRGAGSTVGALRQGYSKFIDPEVQTQTARALQEGMRPSIAQAAPPAKLLPFEQAMTQRVFGNPAEKGNIAAMQGKVVDHLKAAGWSDEEAQQIAAQMSKGSRDTTAAGDAMVSGAQQRTERSAAAVNAEGAGIRGDIDAQIKAIDTRLGSSDPGLQQQVQKDIVAARQNFGTQATEKYKAADNAIGGQPVYPTAGIRAQAQRIIDAIPKDRDGVPLYAIPQDIKGAANLPDMISLADGQRLRSSFERAGYATDLTPGIEQREYGQLGQAADDAFKQAATLPQGVAAGDAARSLAEADDFYAQGIKKFQQLSVKQLGKEAEISHFADPEKVASAVLRPGYTAQAQRIKQLVSPETWQKVGASYWDGIKNAATIKQYAAGGTDALDGKRLLDQVTKAGKSLDVAYGPEVANSMRDAAKRLAAVDGKLDTTGLTADNFGRRIETYLGNKANHDAMMGDRFVQMLSGNSTVDRDEALGYILKKPDRIAQAKEFYGEASPEWKTIQKEGMAHILQSGMGPGGDLLSEVLKPGGLSGMLRGMNPRAIDDLFGPEVADSLRRLGRQIDFIAAKPKHSGTAAFAAAALVLHPLAHIGTLADLLAAGHIMSSAPFIKWLSLGLDGDTKAMKIAGDIARTVAYTTEPTTPVGEGLAAGVEGVGNAVTSGVGNDVRQTMKDPVGLPPALKLLQGDTASASAPGSPALDVLQGNSPSAPAAADPLKQQGVLSGQLHLNPAIAPKVPAGAPRPFAPGEFLENPNGSWSSEMTVTVQDPGLAGGKPTVIPALWVVNGKPVHVDEDTATRYAIKSGLAFRGYPDMAAAEKASIDRENSWQNVEPKDAGKIPSLWSR